MKTIEQKALAYDEAIKKIKYVMEHGVQPVLNKEDLQGIFPELKESEDERIREEIIATIHLYYGEPLEDEAKEMISWLEKQGKKTQGKSALEAANEEKIDNSNKVEPKDYSSVDPLFFKTTDKGKERR